MATRRKRTKREAGRKPPARRAAPRTTAGRGRASSRRSGARAARPAEAARELRTAEPARAPPEEAARPSPLRLAEPPAPDEAAEQRPARRDDAADREAAELARRIEAAVGSAGDLRMGPASAADQLRLHREQTEEAARRQEDARRLPGAGAIALELAGGAWRLARTLAIAPLRLGLAFLRRGDAPA